MGCQCHLLAAGTCWVTSTAQAAICLREGRVSRGLMLPSSLPKLYRPGLYRASSRPLLRAAHWATKEADSEQP